MITKKQIEKVADIIKQTKDRIADAERTGSGFDEIQFLIDEFAYWLEDENRLFNETRFRQYILDIK